MIFYFFSIVFVALLSLASCEVFVSKRFELLSYMKKNNCKNMLLNRVITKIVNENTFYKLSYESLYNFVHSHFPQFDRPEVYRCYEVLSQKYINERKFTFQ